MSFTRNTRLHPDAMIPLADAVLETTDGAVTLAVPTGCSGIQFQNLGSNASYWSVDGAMTDVEQGFKIGTIRQVFWFSPSHIQNIYLYINADDTVIYQFLAPVAY